MYWFRQILMVFVAVESRRLKMRYGCLSLFGLCVGVSLALPLFLLLRERHLIKCSQQGIAPSAASAYPPSNQRW